MHKYALDFLADLKKQYKPDKIIHLGDEMDQCALSDFDSDPNGMSAGDEYLAAMAQLKGLYKLFPKVMVCESNHGKRPFRRAFKAGIPRVYLKAYTEFMQSPAGWVWQERWIIDGVVYKHGDGFTGPTAAFNAASTSRKSTVIGHVHSNAGMAHLAGESDHIFGMNVGCLVDTDAYAFKYGLHNKHKPVLGAGIVIDGRFPIFVPLK